MKENMVTIGQYGVCVVSAESMLFTDRKWRYTTRPNRSLNTPMLLNELYTPAGAARTAHFRLQSSTRDCSLDVQPSP